MNKVPGALLLRLAGVLRFAARAGAAALATVGLATVGLPGTPARPTTPTLAGSFVPGLIARAGSSSTVMVLGTATCTGGGRHLCLGLWSATVGRAGLVDRLTKLTAPPSTRPKFAGSTGLVGAVVFSNRLDGYAVEHSSSQPTASTVFATTDGGRSWRRAELGAGSVWSMVATAHELYAVTAHCSGRDTRTTGITCDDYRLARSTAGSASWRSVRIPGEAANFGNGIGLGAEGDRVWLTYQALTAGAEPVLLTSVGGVAPFSSRSEPSLEGIGPCWLDATPGGALWAACPTGMMVSYLRSPDGGRHFSAYWDFAGTGGASVDPVSAQVAYRYTGIGRYKGDGYAAIPADEVQRTTDGGAEFSSVGHLPSNFGAGALLLFLNETDGFALGSIVQRGGDVGVEVSALLETHDAGRTWTRVSF